MKKIILLCAVVFALSACNNEPKKPEQIIQNETKETGSLTGSYVSDGYTNRTEGYDWVSVSVSEADHDQLNIKVRSRADKKKPTCTFDAIAYKVDDKTYESAIDNKSIVFTFSDTNLAISTKNEADNSILTFYCSGGASLAGSYKKINGEPDKTQIDKTQFSKVLNLQNVGFNVSSAPKDNKNLLTVFTFGLPNDYNENFDIGNNIITNAEVEDLNADGSPELVVYAQSQENPKRMSVYAFSVNNKKSMSQVYFPPISENNEINNGYNGEDDFSLVENYLVQQFPVYNNGKKTEKIRQIQYKLIDGEATRKFVVVKQNEINMK